jgi:hypothetical protein
LKTKPLEDENHQDNPSDLVTDNAIDFITDKAIDFVTDKQNQKQVLLNQETNKPRSCRTRILTRYIRDIQSGIGTTDGKLKKTNLPAGIQIPKMIPQVEGETEDTSQIEHAMAAAVSKIEAINPPSLEEAMGQPDKPKWEIAIQEELNNLQKAGTWIIVERPKERNIVKNKWVFRIKKDAAGKIE